MTNSSLTMAGLGSMLLAVVLIVVIFQIVPVIGYSVDKAVDIPTNTPATVTLSFNGIVNGDSVQTANLSTETYTFTNGTAGAFKVDVGSAAANATYSCTQFTTQVNADSLLVTAGTCASNATLLTSIIKSSAANAYTSTENLTNAAYSGVTMTGGVTGSNWDSATNTNLPTGNATWGTLASFGVLTAVILFVGGFIGALRGIRG